MSRKSAEKARYNEYLCSREWNVLKEAVKKRSGGKCERCKINDGDAVHHLTYERKYNEKLEDLQHICQGCHDFTHGKSDVDPAVASKWRRYLTLCQELQGKPIPIQAMRARDGVWQAYIGEKESALCLAWRIINDAYVRYHDAISMLESGHSDDTVGGMVLDMLARAVLNHEQTMPWEYGQWMRMGMPLPDSEEEYTEDMVSLGWYVAWSV